MTIAEWITAISGKIAEIKSQIPFVYDSGYTMGHHVGSNEGYTDGITEKENELNEHLLDAIVTINQYLENPEEPISAHGRISYLDENIPNVYENGRNDWWLKFQQLRELRGYQYAFRNNTWTDDIYEPVMPINAVSGQNHNDMFRNTWITDTKVPIYFKHTGASLVFSGTSLQTIHLLDVVDSVTFASWFANCTALENITMSGVIGNDIDFQYSPLNKDSIISIIGCLSSTASGKTLTLNKEAVNAAFVIDVDDESTYPVGSKYYALRHSRENWNFNYI